MKAIIKTIALSIITILTFSACLKHKTNEPAVNEPTPITDPPEVITTLRLSIIDSTDITQTPKWYVFKDPDGDGGQVGAFLNESGTHDTILLTADHTYFTKVYILDESKTPTDSTSNVIAGDESSEHMLFYNGNPTATGNAANTVLNAGLPYSIKTNGSNITITYLDVDNGSPQLNIGLSTRWRSSVSTGTIVNPITIALRHQPGAKDGTYGPGETDVEIEFKVKVN